MSLQPVSAPTPAAAAVPTSDEHLQDRIQDPASTVGMSRHGEVIGGLAHNDASMLQPVAHGWYIQASGHQPGQAMIEMVNQ